MYWYNFRVWFKTSFIDLYSLIIWFGNVSSLLKVFHLVAFNIIMLQRFIIDVGFVSTGDFENASAGNQSTEKSYEFVTIIPKRWNFSEFVVAEVPQARFWPNLGYILFVTFFIDTHKPVVLFKITFSATFAPLPLIYLFAVEKPTISSFRDRFRYLYCSLLPYIFGNVLFSIIEDKTTMFFWHTAFFNSTLIWTNPLSIITHIHLVRSSTYGQTNIFIKLSKDFLWFVWRESWYVEHALSFWNRFNLFNERI